MNFVQYGVHTLRGAVQADERGEWNTALSLYIQGIDSILRGIKEGQLSECAKDLMRERVNIVLQRAEELKRKASLYGNTPHPPPRFYHLYPSQNDDPTARPPIMSPTSNLHNPPQYQESAIIKAPVIQNAPSTDRLYPNAGPMLYPSFVDLLPQPFPSSADNVTQPCIINSGYLGSAPPYQNHNHPYLPAQPSVSHPLPYNLPPIPYNPNPNYFKNPNVLPPPLPHANSWPQPLHSNMRLTAPDTHADNKFAPSFLPGWSPVVGQQNVYICTETVPNQQSSVKPPPNLNPVDPVVPLNPAKITSVSAPVVSPSIASTPNDKLLKSLSQGIVVSVEKQLKNHLISTRISLQDTEIILKYVFTTTGGLDSARGLTIKADIDFEFEDYAPFVFRYHRQLDGISEEMFIKAMLRLEGMESKGKSGSKFFLSDDHQFVIKSLTLNELQFLRSTLLSYTDYRIKEKDNLLPRFYSLHTYRRIIPSSNVPPLHFIVMANVIPPGKNIFKIFDLKGSTIGRAATADEKQKGSAILKDLDFDEPFRFSEEKKHLFFTQLQKDCQYLEDHTIMDYSLLVGIAVSSSSVENKYYSQQQNTRLSIFQSDDGGFRGLDGKVYYMGIIDVLQPYNLFKKVEHAIKSISNPSDQLSCVDPKTYSERFQQFIYHNTALETNSPHYPSLPTNPSNIWDSWVPIAKPLDEQRQSSYH